jgi:hypothetical protein
MSKSSYGLLIPLLLSVHSYCFAQATDVYYMRADYNEPWCCGWGPYENSNPLDLDNTFGAGGWTLQMYEYADPYAIFSANTCYVFMEGGESHTDQLEIFFSNNQAIIEQWVYNGGSLFINAAPNVGDGLSCGFGDVWLWYPYAWPGDVSADPAGAGHMIWSGPFTPTTTNMFGPSYSHAYITGSGLTPIIVDTWSPDLWVLSEKSWGLGHVFFGTMTTACWHWPSTEAVNIRQNMHSYMFLVCGLLLSDQSLEFAAIPAAQGAVLQWDLNEPGTASYFEISRSKNGTDWELLNTVEVGTAQSYEVIDDAPFSGKSYYSLQLKTFAGETLQEKVAPVQFESSFDVYPNPAQNRLVISGENAESAEYSVYSLSGDVVSTTKQTGMDEVLLNFTGLLPGVYTLCIEKDGLRSFKEIVIL